MKIIINNILVIFCYINFFLAMISVAYSIYKVVLRRNKAVYLTKFLLYFGYFMLITFLIIFVMTFLVKNNINNEDKNITLFLLFIVFYGTFGNTLVWMWSSWSIGIHDDKFIYSHILFGKETINFKDINVKDSRYLFIFSRGKRDFANEVLILTMNNKKIYKFNLNVFLRSGNTTLLTNTIIFKLKLKREKISK